MGIVQTLTNLFSIYIIRLYEYCNMLKEQVCHRPSKREEFPWLKEILDEG